MSTGRYLTLAGESEGFHREKASKFLAYAFPITDEEHFVRRLDELAKMHHSSRHVCWARVLGTAGEFFRQNDAGEPSGTAGKPILRQLQGASLTFSAIVVVRYFGGTLLGKAGLVHAYADAARDALAHAVIVEHVVRSILTVRCSYAQVEEVKREVLRHEGELIGGNYGERCVLRVAVAQDAVAHCVEQWTQQGILVVADQEK